MIAHLWGCENRAGALRLDRTPVHRAEWIALDETATALRSWASARRDLLEGVEGVWPQDRSRRCRPDPEGTDRVRTVLHNWDLEPGPSALDAVAGREIAQIEQAILRHLCLASVVGISPGPTRRSHFLAPHVLAAPTCWIRREGHRPATRDHRRPRRRRARRSPPGHRARRLRTGDTGSHPCSHPSR